MPSGIRKGSLCYFIAWNLTLSTPFQDLILQGARSLLSDQDQTPRARARPQWFGGHPWGFCLYLWRKTSVSCSSLADLARQRLRTWIPENFCKIKKTLWTWDFTHNGIMGNTTKLHLIYFHIELPPRLHHPVLQKQLKLLFSWMGTVLITSVTGKCLGGVYRK